MQLRAVDGALNGPDSCGHGCSLLKASAGGQAGTLPGTAMRHPVDVNGLKSPPRGLPPTGLNAWVPYWECSKSAKRGGQATQRMRFPCWCCRWADLSCPGSSVVAEEKLNDYARRRVVCEIVDPPHCFWPARLLQQHHLQRPIASRIHWHIRP